MKCAAMSCRGLTLLFLFVFGSFVPKAFSDEFGDVAAELEDEFASAVPASSRDPLRPLNRVFFTVNDRLYFWVLEPVADRYARIAPEAVRVAVSRFFDNLGFPARAVSNSFQGKFARTGHECARFVVNTTVGILGFRDPAETWLEIEPAPEDFGQTLAVYGVGEGFPVVLPILGPANVRDMVGMVVDYFLDPISYLDSFRLRMALRGSDRLNQVSLHLGEYEQLKAGTLDAYTFIISAYRQNRDGQIKE